MNQTTINHKFKKGDKVRLIGSTSPVIFTVVAMDIYFPKTSDEIEITYGIKDDLGSTFTFWKPENELELVAGTEK